jgi:acyl carrier protein
MTREELRAAVLESLGTVAPEADPAVLDPDVPIREQLDLDSIDFLRFLTELDRRVHVELPETDYSKVATLDGLLEYLAARIPPSVG